MALVGGNLIVYLTTDTRQFEAGMSKATGYLEGFQGAAKIAAGILMRDLVRGLTTGAVESLKMGAQIQTLEASFKSLSQATGEYVPSLSELRTATKGMVSDTDLLLRANEALALGIPTENLDKLFDSAIRLGKAMGIDATQGIQALTIGVGRQSRLVLDNLGVIVKAESAYEEYAQMLGKTAEALTENERRIAFQTVALEKISEKAAILGDNISATDVSMAQWTATIKNTTTAIGEMLQPLGAFAPALQTLGPSLGIMGAQILPTLSAATLGWGAAVALGVIGIVGLISAMKDYRQRTDEVILAQNRLKTSMNEVTLAVKEIEAAEQALESALSGQDVAWNAYSDAVDRRADASERLVDAEEELRQAEEGLAVAQQDLASFTSYLRGDTEQYIAVTSELVYATGDAETGIQTLSMELQGLQGIVSATSAELQGLQGEMRGLTDEEQRINLQLLKVEDAYRDGRMSKKQYERSVKSLRGKLRNLNIEQAELSIQIRDTTRDEEEQAKAVDETQSNLDALIKKNAEALAAQETLESATESLDDARIAEIETINSVNEALGGLEMAHDNVVMAQDAVRQSNAELETSLRAVEQATKDLNAAENQRAADRAMRQQDVFGGMGAGDLVPPGGSSVVTNVGGATSTSQVNITVDMTSPTSSPEAGRYAEEFADEAVRQLRRRGVLR